MEVGDRVDDRQPEPASRSLRALDAVKAVEHAGAVNDAMLASIAAAMTRRYGRPVTASARANPALLAGIRVHVGDDIYESSVAGQLAALAASV